MHPIFLKFTIPFINFPVTIYFYGVLAALGFISAYYLIMYRLKSYDEDKGFVSDLLFYSVVGGIIGARLTYVIINWQVYKNNLLEILKIYNGGIVFYGGMVTGILTGITIVIFKKKKISKYLDLVAPAIALGHAFGRIGCLMYGCCFGKVCHSPIGMHFPKLSPAYYFHIENHLINNTNLFSLNVYPTQLISSLFLFSLCLFLLFFDKKIKTFSGQLFSVYLIIYSIFRFTIEFFRAYEPNFYLLFNLTFSQYVSIFLFITGIIFYIKFKVTNQ